LEHKVLLDLKVIQELKEQLVHKVLKEQLDQLVHKEM
jgi:hypothetical protein